MIGGSGRSCVTHRLRHGLNGLLTQHRHCTITFVPALIFDLMNVAIPHKVDSCTHLTIKSNSEPASNRTPNKVEKAPSSTGANMCSRASTARL